MASTAKEVGKIYDITFPASGKVEVGQKIPEMNKLISIIMTAN